MTTFGERLTHAVDAKAGETDLYYSKELDVHRAQVNQEARLLAARGEVIRAIRPDGFLGTFPVSSPSTIAARLERAVHVNPGATDAFFSERLRLHRAQVNQEARLLSARSVLI